MNTFQILPHSDKIVTNKHLQVTFEYYKCSEDLFSFEEGSMMKKFLQLPAQNSNI